jgi:hypothetical protein
MMGLMQLSGVIFMSLFIIKRGSLEMNARFDNAKAAQEIFENLLDYELLKSSNNIDYNFTEEDLELHFEKKS